MTAWSHFWSFWVVGQQLGGAVVLAAFAYLVGRYKVKPFLYRQHRERIDQAAKHEVARFEQAERHHKASMMQRQRHHDQIVTRTPWR